MKKSILVIAILLCGCNPTPPTVDTLHCVDNHGNSIAEVPNVTFWTIEDGGHTIKYYTGLRRQRDRKGVIMLPYDALVSCSTTPQ